MIHPVFVGSSYKNKGVQELLDAVVDYMPSPIRRAGHQGHEPGHGARKTSVPSDVKAPFSALAFKIMTDPFVGTSSPTLRVVLGASSIPAPIVSNAYEGQEGAHRPFAADALEPARRYRRLRAAGDIVASWA